jgi:hypothetical protein
VRRECLDHVVIFSERQLLTVLDEYVRYFDGARPHQALAQSAPMRTSVAGEGEVVAVPVLGLGELHHDYRRAA